MASTTVQPTTTTTVLTFTRPIVTQTTSSTTASGPGVVQGVVSNNNQILQFLSVNASRPGAPGTAAVQVQPAGTKTTLAPRVVQIPGMRLAPQMIATGRPGAPVQLSGQVGGKIDAVVFRYLSSFLTKSNC